MRRWISMSIPYKKGPHGSQNPPHSQFVVFLFYPAVMGNQGRGSAGRAVAVIVVCCWLVLESQMAAAAVYTVGDSKEWTFNTVSWPNGKRFRAGDVLVFKYSRSAHNVVAVNAGGYRGCTTPRGSRVYSSGNDRITLRKGNNYFLCNYVGHCQAGMKIAVTAA